MKFYWKSNFYVEPELKLNKKLAEKRKNASKRYIFLKKTTNVLYY